MGLRLRQFRQWTLAGVRELLLEALNDIEGVGETVQMIESTVIRAHHCAAAAKGVSETGSGALARWLHDEDSAPHQWLACP